LSVQSVITADLLLLSPVIYFSSLYDKTKEFSNSP